MTVCPIAVVAGCAKCPAFRICPLKGVLGDTPPKRDNSVEPAPKPRKPASRKRK